MSMTGFGAVYVGDLNPEVTEANLYQIFNSLGPVASVRVCRDAASRRSLGYAYVNYHQAEHAEKAIDTFNGTKINNRPCRVMMSQRDPALRKSQQGNVFVKGLHESVDIKDLHDFFSTYGNILSCKVVTDKAGKSLGYGFVHFEKEEDAKKAVATQSEGRELQIKNKKIEVMPFVPKKKRAPGSAGSVPSTETKDLWIASLHVEVSPQEVRQLFNQKANIDVDDKNVSIRAPREGAKFTVDEFHPDSNTVTKRSVVVTSDNPSPVAYAIVECNNRRDAQAGLEGTAQQPYRNYVLRVDWRKSKFELEKQKEQRRLERQQRNLFVRNLPTSWDEARLKKEFEPYGVVESWLLDEKNGKNKEARKAYVCMQTKEQAEAAMLALNGKQIEDSEISVVLHIPREIQKRGDISPAQQASNVYVKNIPTSWTSESFQREFSKYGKIVSARLATDNGKHRGFGFVAFTTPQEAMNAISGAHGQHVEEGKQPLYVQLFQRKEQRQQQQASRQLPGPPAPAPGYPPYPRGFMYPPAAFRAARYPVQYPPYYRLQEQMQQMAYYPPMAAAPRFHLQPAQARPMTEAQRQQFVQQQQQQQQQARARVAMDPQQAQRRRPPQAVPGQPRRVNPNQLNQLPPQEQKQYLGEHLFQRIATRKPNLAGKITGMLLEMKNEEILSILENDELLNNRVDEAVEVLDRAGLETDSQ